MNRTREQDSPWLQWSAIQTLLERSKSDVLILLDCCAGAASATFPTGNSITETISASSWDAIAPDPGRYSFTNALIEVLSDWRRRVYSVAMLHAEVLARLKHPRPVTINGKHFEARSTPVHFMMTANHKAPSIEISRLGAHSQDIQSPLLLPSSVSSPVPPMVTARGPAGGLSSSASHEIAPAPPADPNEDTPHVMISLALEDDQKLDINAWEQWLNAFPALAKHVKVQGVFKSHSTLLLVSMPVMIWDLLPDDQAVSFVAFIRSNNLAIRNSPQPTAQTVPAAAPAPVTTPSRLEPPLLDLQSDATSFMTGVTGTTFVPAESQHYASSRMSPRSFPHPGPRMLRTAASWQLPSSPELSAQRSSAASTSAVPLQSGISRQVILNQQQSMRRTTLRGEVPAPKKFSVHIESRLEGYFQSQPLPNDAELAMQASNLGIEPAHLAVWYHYRRERAGQPSQSASLGQVTSISPEQLASLIGLSRNSDDAPIVFDTRLSVESYHLSHVVDAIHLAAPESFLQPAPLDLIQRAVASDAGQQAFYRWRDARCAIFYGDDTLEADDCPAATTISGKLRELGWVGRCFVVQGKYEAITQAMPSSLIVASSSAPQGVSPQDAAGDRYNEFLGTLEAAPARAASPEAAEEREHRQHAVQQRLESVFLKMHPDLHHKAAALKAEPVSAELAEPFNRAMDKMRAEMTTHESTSKAMDSDDAVDYVKVPAAYETGSSPQSYDEGRLRGGRGGNSGIMKMFRK